MDQMKDAFKGIKNITKSIKNTVKEFVNHDNSQESSPIKPNKTTI